MPILDDKGRLFGRVNLVDASALLVILFLLPVGLATYRVFRVPSPEIVKIDPGTVRVGGDQVLRLEGRNLRPYLHAYVAAAGQAPPFVDPPTNPNEAAFLLERPTVAELRLPKMAPGVYDLYLYDEGREVARRLSAFTVVTPEAYAPEAPVEKAVLEIAIRFDVDETVASLIHVGDVDLGPSARRASEPATVISLRRLPAPHRPIGFGVSPEGILGASVSPPQIRIEAVVRVGVVKNLGVWLDGTRPVRAGEMFAFATSDWVANGFITRVSVVRRAPEDRAGSRD
ncbi:MAG: DUF4330 domain-containing protein [Acidobacteria bacterium]|nr:DUF4330 domain-containing protein [Acidobacteriota bacterium]